MKKTPAFFKPPPTKKPAGSGLNASRGASMLKQGPPSLQGGKGTAPFIPSRPRSNQSKTGGTMQGPGRVGPGVVEKVLRNTPYTQQGREFLSQVPVTYPASPETGLTPGSGGGFYYPGQHRIELGSGPLEQLGLPH